METMNNNTIAAPTMVVLPKETYDDIINGIQEVKDLINGKAKEEQENAYLVSEEARKMLGVSPKTWQSYRDKRVFPFIQFGRKIYVNRADIVAFLESHKINPTI